ncbi:hypothetical protein DSO57_1029575 [Entomophthora muscae]|uniref:Uncharacterized protein n=1 Tax=Entomophthora muscae TaxID=34485 RepID=A0ACC2RFS1_9FUNG|nr:hypothetical protein DSO57_1029575 [Entomophthora muscae]
MESSGDDEIVETPFLVPGAFNLPSQDSFPSTHVTLAAGHFHTIAFDHSNVKMWTWGAGILGRGSEVYDPLPAPITFFADANIKVRQVLSAGDYSLAVQDAKNPDQSLVFIWGYLPSSDMDGETQAKANFPIVIRDLASDNVRHLAAIPTGFSVLVAKSNSHASFTWRLKWFGSMLFNINQSRPYYPYFQENTDQLHSYDFAPSISIPLPFQTPNDEPFQLTVGAGMAGIFKSGRLLLIDLSCSCLGDEPKVSVAGFTGIESATLTDEGLSFIRVSNSEAKLYHLSKSCLQPKLQAQPGLNLPTFDELVDTLSQDGNPVLETGYSLPLQGSQNLSKVLRYEYGNIWTLTTK